MAKPETVQQIKSYSAESGYVYQYQFQDAHPVRRGSAKGNEYVYYVSADRKKLFPVRIFVGQQAMKKVGRSDGARSDGNGGICGGEDAAISGIRRRRGAFRHGTGVDRRRIESQCAAPASRLVTFLSPFYMHDSTAARSAGSKISKRNLYPAASIRSGLARDRC